MKVAARLAKTRGQRLYACAIDASKAYDKVSRNKLWVKLIEKKIPPEIINATFKYYESSLMVVQLNEEFSELFTTTIGVRQGGTCSSKLFSIYIKGVVQRIEVLKAGIKLVDTDIDVIIYADDIIIVATSKAGIQKQLNTIGEYGTEHGIKYNPNTNVNS